MCIGAGVKFAVLYAGVVKSAIPYILTLSDKQAAAFDASIFVSAINNGRYRRVVWLWRFLPALKKH